MLPRPATWRGSEEGAALAYVRASVCNLTRNRHRHLRVVRRRTPAGRHEDSSEQAVILKEEHREVLTALAGLPGGGTNTSTASLPPSSVTALGIRRLSEQVPPSSAVLSYQYSPEGKKIYAVFWLGHRNQAFWFDNVSPGLQLCSALFNIYTTQRPEYGTTGPELPATLGSGEDSAGPRRSCPRGRSSRSRTAPTPATTRARLPP